MRTVNNIISVTVVAMEHKKLTLSVPEAGQVLGIGRAAAYDAARAGQIPTVRIGKRLLVPVAALERLLAIGVLPLGANDLTQPEKASR
jgi:excisionase family DNA binding protein